MFGLPSDRRRMRYMSMCAKYSINTGTRGQVQFPGFLEINNTILYVRYVNK